MVESGEYIVTINAGSSSVKFALYRVVGEPACVQRGSIEGIGSTLAVFLVRNAAGAVEIERSASGMTAPLALSLVLEWLNTKMEQYRVVAVGHRVVHGGPTLHVPTLITPEVYDTIASLVPFAPNHLPDELAYMHGIGKRFPSLPQVACFDTAFHSAMPRVAQLTGLPRKYDTKGIRRYGFHGLSYEYLMHQLEHLEPDRVRGRVVLAHLGNGVSLAAVSGGKPMDTTMGFTPLAGVPMSTRAGDIDPGLVEYLLHTEGLDATQFHTMMSKESGLFGVSETSGNMRELLELRSTDVRAAEAVDFFTYHIRKTIGAYAAAMGGIDLLVFAGGIGERSPEIREEICAGLGFLGIVIDRGKNSTSASVVSSDDSRVPVHVITTDEAWVIAHETHLLTRSTSSTP